jgi:hypothetical protein
VRFSVSVDVFGCDGEETFFSNVGWAFILEFAKAYGWEPSGSVAPPNHREWDRSYDPPQGQTITSADAEELSAAICRGLDAPDRLHTSEKVARILSQEAGRPIQEFNFSEKAVEDWRNFIRIAKKGPFVIW